MPRANMKAQHFSEVRSRHEEGETLRGIAADLGVSEVTLGRWFREEGVKVIHRGRAKEPDKWVAVTCAQCGKEFSIQRSQKRRFCSRNCANDWQREHAIKKTCPCGKSIEKAPGATYLYTYRKYCSDECRAKYGKRRQKDPAKLAAEQGA